MYPFVLSLSKGLNAVDDFFAEQPLRPEQQEHQREHVGKPDFDAAADQGSDVNFRELFSHADDQAADDGAGHVAAANEGQACLFEIGDGCGRHARIVSFLLGLFRLILWP